MYIHTYTYIHMANLHADPRSDSRARPDVFGEARPFCSYTTSPKCPVSRQSVTGSPKHYRVAKKSLFAPIHCSGSTSPPNRLETTIWTRAPMVSGNSGSNSRR